MKMAVTSMPSASRRMITMRLLKSSPLLQLWAHV